MKRLKKRTRSDTHVSEARRPRPRSWDRNVYLALLVVFFGALGNYVFGDRLFLRADGLVLQNRTVIGATALVQITEVAVRPGQEVEDGQILLKAESLETLSRLADLSMRDAELAEREARLQSQLTVARELEPRAERRLSELRERSRTLEDLETSQLVTAGRRETLSDTLHDADIRAATLTAQIEGLSDEITALASRRRQARDAMQDLRTRYQDGIHMAATAGTVGDVVPAPGEVMNPGDPILTLYWGEPYVLAYLPSSYLFDLSVGEQVTATVGNLTRHGRIDAILPMSSAIPDEFRNAFRLRETRQLARITLAPGPDLPTRASVRITRDWRLSDVLSRLAAQLDPRGYVRLAAIDPKEPSAPGDTDDEGRQAGW
ncbi:hypothetical protein [Palleronia sp. LCG004]|uniref:HlyD family secretion protein n=1 Tax=Palleronia sp. LCG004 TaxID=3079304 RepID=UPI002941D605|nr:hypothetical protein [Palleronia sp. LCG004]WOI58256.1 hypothetical protein RVY76_18045 [Palleronia sp. LCG004]